MDSTKNDGDRLRLQLQLEAKLFDLWAHISTIMAEQDGSMWSLRSKEVLASRLTRLTLQLNFRPTEMHVKVLERERGHFQARKDDLVEPTFVLLAERLILAHEHMFNKKQLIGPQGRAIYSWSRSLQRLERTRNSLWRGHVFRKRAKPCLIGGAAARNCERKTVYEREGMSAQLIKEEENAER